jgi:hypothetical protein
MSGSTAGRPRSAPESEAPPRSAPEREPPRGARLTLKRVVLAALTTLVSVNLLTGGPVFSLWVGSRIQAAAGHLSMAAVGATVGILIVVTFVLYKAISYLNAAYNEAIGRRLPRQQVPWHKPMTGERRSVTAGRPLSAIERIVVGTVVLAALAFEVWFFVFAHARLPS